MAVRLYDRLGGLTGEPLRTAGGGVAVTGDQSRRSGWETMLRNLDADAVLADAALYAAGQRRLTVEHGEPLSAAAGELLRSLVDQVAHVVDDAGDLCEGTLTVRSTSLTWTFPSTDVPARDLVLAARTVADRLNPGGWVITADDHR